MIDVKGSASDGFTLLELLVVLAILSLMVALVVPFSLHTVEAAQQRSQVRSAIAELHSLQSLAVTRHHEIVVKNILAKNNHALFVRDPQLPKSKTTFAGTNGAITYYADGSSSGGLLDVGSVEIEVAWLSGAITTRPLP